MQQTIAELISKAEALLADEKVDEARALVEADLKAHDKPRLWRFYKRILLICGEEEAAAAIMKRIVGAVHLPTPVELALAGSSLTAFTEIPAHQLLYVHVPKCGSTTVKDMLYYLIKGARGADEVHDLIAKAAPYVRLDRNNLEATHPGWFKFLVVRDPIARLRSYHRFNLMLSNDLAQEAPGKTHYLGLSLQPSYREFLTHFHRYRQVFRTVRAHTNPIAAMAGTTPTLYDWVGPLQQMDNLREKLCKRTGINIPTIHNFPSKNKAKQDPAEDLEEEIRGFYVADYDIYGEWF